jgi:hypothetical protein
VRPMDHLVRRLKLLWTIFQPPPIFSMVK